MGRLLGVGGIVLYGQTDAVAMRKETLEISTQRISVTYEFVNESANSVTLPVVFPLPAYRPGLPAPASGGQPPGFKLTIDGKPRPFKTSVRALLRGRVSGGENKEVTEYLRKVGLTDGQIAFLPGAFAGPVHDISPFAHGRAPRVPRVTEAQLARLREVWLLDNDVNGILEGLSYPEWLAQVSYHWEVTFPPGKIVTVAHSYAPFIGTGSLTDSSLNPYCASQALMRQYQQRSDQDAATVRYILRTANTWKGPIKDFTLRLKKSRPDQWVSLCFPGNFVKVDPLTLEARMTDFSPARDLEVIFLGRINANSGYFWSYHETWGGYGEAPVLNTSGGP